VKLDEYLDRVLNAQDRVLLQEASDCLQAGALRAAYITVWLACAESLRRKFTEAAVRDHQAASVARQIADYEGQHRAVDKLLIEKARLYGLVTDAEATRLTHIYENRNVFGHPYEESPSEQLIVTAVSEVVEIVLGRPLALREGYLSNQSARLSTDITFLADDGEVVSDYARTVHARTAADCRIYFVRKLLRANEAIFADPSLDVLQRRSVWFLRAFLLEDTSVFDVWDPVEDLPDHPLALPGILADRQLFPLVSAHARDIVVNVLLQRTSTEPTMLALLYSLEQDGLLLPRHSQLVAANISSAGLSRLASSGLPLAAWAERLTTELSYKTWDVQNAAVAHLTRAGSQQVAETDAEQQIAIGRALLAAADGTAYRAINLIAEIAASETVWPTSFVEGLVMECFVHEDGAVRLKTDQLGQAIRCLHRVGDQGRRAIVEKTCNLLTIGLVRNPERFERDRAIALEQLDVLARTGDYGFAAELVEALTAKDAT
jgi:hypothetical protein